MESEIHDNKYAEEVKRRSRLKIHIRSMDWICNDKSIRNVNRTVGYPTKSSKAL